VPFRLGFGLLGAVSRFDLFFVHETAGLALKMLLGGIVLTAGLSLPWYSAAVAIPVILVGIWEFRTGLLSVRPVEIGFTLVRSWALRALLSMCGASLLMTIAAALTTHGGTLLIATLGEPAEVAVFALPLMLVSTAMSFAGSFGAFLAPITNELHGTRDAARMREIVVMSVRLAAVLASLLAAGLALMGPILLPVWLGVQAVSEQRLDTMTNLLWIFALGFATFVPGSALKGLLLSVANPWPVAIFELAASVAAIAFAASLYIAFDFGALAIAFTVAVGLAVRGLLLFPWLAARVLNEKFVLFLRAIYLRPLVVIAGAMLVAIVAHESWKAASPLALFGVLLLFLFTSVAGCYFLLFPHQLRQRILQLWR
jgi:O-antigen/teichoic acid export membrane protein